MEAKKNLNAVVIGAALVALGVLSLLGTVFDFVNIGSLWPLILVGIGAVFFIAVVLGEPSWSGLAIPGSIIVMVGLILLVMNFTGTWEAWSYAWALIIFASGVGVWINGIKTQKPELRKSGADTMRGGLTLFFIFAVIMEFIFTATGLHKQLNLWIWAVLLAVLGLVLFVARIFQLRKPNQNPDLFWPVLMIGAGLVVILYQMKLIQVDNLGRLLNLWPVLLIVAGVGVLFRNRAWVGALMGILVVAGVLLVGFYGARLNLPAQPAWLSDLGEIEIEGGDAIFITGSGSLATEERPVSGVNRVALTIPANLEITQGDVESLTVRADDNILPLLTTNVSNGKLTIRYQPRYRVNTAQLPQITLTVKNLEELRNTSNGQVTAGPLQAGDFEVDIFSSGNVSIEELQAGELTVQMTSSGDLSIGGGSAERLNIELTSSGSFEAPDLKAQEADVELTSSGDVTLWVIERLHGEMTSSGNIVYYGDPQVTSDRTSSGKLISKGDK